MNAKEENRADAKNRSLRTLIQGLVIATILGGLGALATGILGMSPGDLLNGGVWAALGLLVLQTALTSAASYFQRRIETHYEDNLN